jgi:hypothetical protein
MIRWSFAALPLRISTEGFRRFAPHAFETPQVRFRPAPPDHFKKSHSPLWDNLPYPVRRNAAELARFIAAMLYIH